VSPTCNPSVSVIVELEPSLCVDPTERASFEALLSARIEKALARILSELGIPGKPDVVTRASPFAQPLRVFLRGDLVPYPRSMARRVWEYLSPTELGGVPLTFSFSDWLKENAARENSTTDGDNLAVVSDLLIQLVVEIVKRKPEKLFLRDQVNAFIERAQQELSTKMLGGQDALCRILTSLLRLGISVADYRTIVQQIADGWEKKLGEEYLTETLISLLGSDAVRVDINSAYLRHLIGTEVNRPLSAYDPCLEVKTGETLGLITDGVFYEMGVRVSDIFFVPNERIKEAGFAIRMNDLMGVPRKGLGPHQLLANATTESLKRYGVSALPAINPANDSECAVIDKQNEEKLKLAQIRTWDPFGFITLALSAEIRRNAERLLDREVVEFELAQLHQGFPSLVLGAVQELPATKLTQVLRLLLAEEVSIRNLRTILERMLNFDYIFVNSAEHTVFDDRLVIPEPLRAPRLPYSADLYAQHVRKGLKSYISHKYARGETLAVYVLSHEIEQRLLEHVASEGLDTTRSPLTSEETEQIRAAIRATVCPGNVSLMRSVILTVSAIRLCMRGLVKDEFSDLEVLAYDELAADYQRQPIYRISLEPSSSNVVERSAS
jgi:flagellar biosynthesis component FlhA